MLACKQYKSNCNKAENQYEIRKKNNDDDMKIVYGNMEH